MLYIVSFSTALFLDNPCYRFVNFIILFKEPGFSLVDSILYFFCILFISIMSFLFLSLSLFCYFLIYRLMFSLLMFLSVFLMFAFKIINFPLRMDSTLSHSF